MPSSLIIGALVLAWLVVLVPMIARKRQEVARTADSALASRIVPRTHVRLEEPAMAEDRTISEEEPAEQEIDDHEFVDEADEDTEEEEFSRDTAAEEQFTTELPLVEVIAGEDYAEVFSEEDEDSAEDLEQDEEFVAADEYTEYAEPEERPYTRPYRPGRGGYDAEAAELAAAAQYALRRKIVLGLLLSTLIAVILGAALAQPIYWAAGALGVALIGYLSYLRRQVRIEADIRQRRAARIRAAHTAARSVVAEDTLEKAPMAPMRPRASTPAPRPGTTIVDNDDGDPAFDDLDEPDVLPYRRAVGQ